MLDDKMLELNRKIQQVLNRKEVKTDNEIITFYELANSCKEAMFPYNYFFYTDTAEIAKDINFRIQFKNMLGKNIPYIGEVIPTIDEEGKCYVNVGLVNNSNKRAGNLLIQKERYPEIIGVDDKLLNNLSFFELVDSCDESFKDETKVLEKFKEDYPDISYKWDKKHPDPKSKFSVSDGFIEGRIDLNNVEHSKVGLSNLADINLATMHTKKYGELYDYIDFYNEYIQLRLGVNINDLNPLMKQLVTKQLNLGGSKQLKLK